MERIEALWIDEIDGKAVLKMTTGTKRCQATLTDFAVVEPIPQDELKKLMGEIGDNLSKIAGKGHEMIKEKRKDVLKGLRDWIDKELA